MNSMKRQNDRILKEELPGSVGTQYATGDQWRNNSRKNEGVEPKQKEYPAVDVTGDRSKVQCCKEQYCIRSDQIRSVAQSCLTLWDPMNRSTPGLPVHHQLPEFTQTHVHRVGSHLILRCPLLLLPPIPPSIRVFSNESTLLMR